MSEIITRPRVEIDPELLLKLKDQVDEAGQVVLHFILKNVSSHDSQIRIWPTTYLYDLGSSHVSELVHAENITLFPTWQIIHANSKAYFTLVFTGLPRSCTSFQFKENCTNQAGAWYVESIIRNDSDVYYLEIA